MSVQQKFPLRATVRTAFQILVFLAAFLPVALPVLGVSTTVGWGAVALAAALGVTRLMQTPAVEQLLQDWAPWLASAPRLPVPSGGYPEEHDDFVDSDTPTPRYTEPDSQ